jgi:hypothetical protein
MSSPIGQVSPDGLWTWNGTQWVPTGMGRPYPQPRPYESARFRSTFVIIFLGVNAVAILLGMIVDVAYIVAGGTLNSLGDAATIGFGLVAVVFLVAYYGSLIPSVVLFCMWLHRVVRNMPALGAPDPKWTPAGAVGRCFIPFLNFLHPYRSTVDAWRGSDSRQLRADQSMRNQVPVPGLLVGWWLTWLGGRVISLFSNSMISSSDPATTTAGAYIDLVANLVIIVAAALAILVVRQLTARQDLKQELISTGRLV